MTGRPAYSYRASRRNQARRLKQIWRALERHQLGDGSIYVPPVVAQNAPPKIYRPGRAA